MGQEDGLPRPLRKFPPRLFFFVRRLFASQAPAAPALSRAELPQGVANADALYVGSRLNLALQRCKPFKHGRDELRHRGVGVDGTHQHLVYGAWAYMTSTIG